MKALIFGSLGSIGNHIFHKFTNDNIETIGTTTNLDKITEQVIFVDKDNLNNLLNIDNLDCKINEPGDITTSHWHSLKNIGCAGPKLKPEHLIYFGVRDFEDAEQFAMTKNNIRLVKVDELRYRGLDICVKEAIGKLLDCDLIYISFDVDSMDCDHVSYGTGTPVPNGFLPNEVMQIIEILLATNKVCCIEFTEINPLLDNKGNKMAETAFQVLDYISAKIPSV